jgi:2-C-methyl-D-erythritol 4-phosphate cytidylyltransferase
MAVALLVAAGSGERLGAGRPKAFVVLAGHPMVEWSLAALRAAPSVERVVVAVPPGARHAGAIAHDAELAVVEGGPVRSASVANALAAAGDADEVVVHDAARPLLSAELVEATLAELDDADAAIAAAPLTDTVKEASPDRWVAGTLDRTRLWAVQTPQAFRRAALESALAVPDEVLAGATDDAWLVERAGGRVRVVESSAANVKITTPYDLRLAEWLLSERQRAHGSHS